MTVALNDGEIVNSCDAVTGFSVGNISGDDDFVEGTGAIGLKLSSATTEMYTTTLGATAPYDFSSGGSEFGFHIIMWFNTKTSINATTGMTIIVGDSTGGDRGRWNVIPTGFYKGGFVTSVVDSARDFDTISLGTWTTTGNPAQLSAIDEVGGGFTTLTSIMGSFNNVQLDQMTIGTGLRVDVGTVGTPNDFETVRAQDEDTSFWGWWSSSKGIVVGKGKLYIGPATGTATSVFTSVDEKVVFADERVSATFYEILTRGTNTDVTFTRIGISRSSSTSPRWGVTVDSTTKTFVDTDGNWNGSGAVVLNSTSTLTNTVIIDGTSMALNGGTLTGIRVIQPNTADGVAYLTCSTLANISGCEFNFTDGHAIEIDTAGTYSFVSNTFVGAYGGTPGSNLTPSSGSTDAMIYNTSGGLVTINITTGTTPSIRNNAGSTTQVNNNITLTIGPIVNNSEVRVYATSGGAELDGVENSTGGQFVASFAASTNVFIVIIAKGYVPVRLENKVFTVSQSLDPNQKIDPNQQ